MGHQGTDARAALGRGDKVEAYHADAFDWNRDGDLDLLTGQGHGGSGIRFCERDYLEDWLNDTHPIVSVVGFERAEAATADPPGF